MSWEATEWVARGALDGGSILPARLVGKRIGRDRVAHVLEVLAHHAGTDGVAWPGWATLELETRLPRRLIREAVTVLVELGLVQLIGAIGRAGNAGRGNVRGFLLMLPGAAIQGHLPGVDNSRKDAG